MNGLKQRPSIRVPVYSNNQVYVMLGNSLSVWEFATYYHHAVRCYHQPVYRWSDIGTQQRSIDRFNNRYAVHAFVIACSHRRHGQDKTVLSVSAV